jgi:hypothetical protein
MGEDVPDKTVNQLVLNGLPRSFESIIQTMMLLNASLTFDQMSSTLLAEAHRRKHCTFQLGDEEALATTFNRQASLAQHGHYSQFQGRFFRGGPRGVPG